jgi:hypothetical protein
MVPDPKDTSLEATLERFLDALERAKGSVTQDLSDGLASMMLDVIKHKKELLPALSERLSALYVELPDDTSQLVDGWLGFIEAEIRNSSPSMPVRLTETFPYEREILDLLLPYGEEGQDAVSLEMQEHRRPNTFKPSLEGMVAGVGYRRAQPLATRATASLRTASVASRCYKEAPTNPTGAKTLEKNKVTKHANPGFESSQGGPQSLA